MIRGLDVSAILGAVPVRLVTAPGVVSAIADRYRKSPWLDFTGARASFELDGAREVEITPERWAYIRKRAAEELPDPGLAENVAELLWSDGIAEAWPALDVCAYPPSGCVDVEVTDAQGVRFRNRTRVPMGVPAAKREEWIAVPMYLQIVAEIAAACPPEIEITHPADGANERRAYEGRGPEASARCAGCDERMTFGASRGFQIPNDDEIRRQMARGHQLCCARGPQRFPMATPKGFAP